MVDNEFDDEDGDPPIRAKYRREHLPSTKNGLSPEDERALQDALQGYRATRKVICWMLKAVTQGLIAALTGLIAAGIFKSLWPTHFP